MYTPGKKPVPGLGAYKKTEVLTSNRESILILMYEGAIRFVSAAIEANATGNIAERGKNIVKTQDIINELRATLNFEVGGELAKHLEMLYGYITERLLTATVQGDSKPLEDAKAVLNTLLEGWIQAVESIRKEKVTEVK